MKIIFIGNRINVLKQLLKHDEYKIDIFCLKDSYLEKNIKDITKKYRLFTFQEKNMVIESIIAKPYDILISNGIGLSQR